jgi:hypothetical protein
MVLETFFFFLPFNHLTRLVGGVRGNCTWSLRELHIARLLSTFGETVAVCGNRGQTEEDRKRVTKNIYIFYQVRQLTDMTYLLIIVRNYENC